MTRSDREGTSIAAATDSPSGPGQIGLNLGGICVFCDQWVYPVRGGEVVPLDAPMHRWCKLWTALELIDGLNDEGPFEAAMGW